MKIRLPSGMEEKPLTAGEEKRRLEAILAAVRRGDWEARDLLAQSFQPLLTALAEKRSTPQVSCAALVDAGKQGLVRAAEKFSPSQGADSFRIFAVDYIERAMETLILPSKGGFLARLFGRR